MSVGFFSVQFAFSVLATAGTLHFASGETSGNGKNASHNSASNVNFRNITINLPLLIALVSLWTATSLASTDVLPSALFAFIWLLAFASVVHIAWKAWQIEFSPAHEAPTLVHRRLLQLQHQLLKLHEKEALGAQLEKTNQSQETLNQYGEHFKRVLITIENHLIYGEHEHAEHVITLFSRHLRQLLHEGSSPFLSLENSIDHIKTHLDLMALLTGNRFICDVDDDMLDSTTLLRCTERFQLSPWVEERVWPFFSLAERSLKDLHPMTLVIDVENDEVLFTFSGQETESNGALAPGKFRLLGNSETPKKSIEHPHALQPA